MRRDPRFPQYQPIVRHSTPTELRNPVFGRRSVAGGAGGGAVTAAPVYLVTVLGGNESVVPPDDTVVRGIKKAASKPIPLAVYDPSPATPVGLPWPDGIGYGNMVIAGSTQRVVLAYYDGAPTTLTGTVISGTPVAVSEKVLLTDGGDPAIEVEAWVVRHV